MTIEELEAPTEGRVLTEKENTCIMAYHRALDELPNPNTYKNNLIKIRVLGKEVSSRAISECQYPNENIAFVDFIFTKRLGTWVNPFTTWELTKSPYEKL